MENKVQAAQVVRPLPQGTSRVDSVGQPVPTPHWWANTCIFSPLEDTPSVQRRCVKQQKAFVSSGIAAWFTQERVDALVAPFAVRRAGGSVAAQAHNSAVFSLRMVREFTTCIGVMRNAWYTMIRADGTVAVVHPARLAASWVLKYSRSNIDTARRGPRSYAIGSDGRVHQTTLAQLVQLYEAWTNGVLYFIYLHREVIAQWITRYRQEHNQLRKTQGGKRVVADHCALPESQWLTTGRRCLTFIDVDQMQVLQQDGGPATGTEVSAQEQVGKEWLPTATGVTVPGQDLMTPAQAARALKLLQTAMAANAPRPPDPKPIMPPVKPSTVNATHESGQADEVRSRGVEGAGARGHRKLAPKVAPRKKRQRREMKVAASDPPRPKRAKPRRPRKRSRTGLSRTRLMCTRAEEQAARRSKLKLQPGEHVPVAKAMFEVGKDQKADASRTTYNEESFRAEDSDPGVF